jgi:hypothetical protein
LQNIGLHLNQGWEMKFFLLLIVSAIVAIYGFISIESIIETMYNSKSTFAYLLGELSIKSVILYFLIKLSFKIYGQIKKENKQSRYSV